MKNIIILMFVFCIYGCTKEELPKLEPELACYTKSFMESFTLEPGQCVEFKELPDKTFTLLELGTFEKQENTVPHASIGYSFKELNSYQEWFDIFIYEDYEKDVTSFSGRFHFIVDGNVSYTIYVDNIEFAETETEYIFKKITFRFGEYDPEY